MKVSYEGKPIAKARHRMYRNIAYDPQAKLKNKIKSIFAAQFRSQGYLEPLKGAIAAKVDAKYPIPKSWSKKRQASVLTGIDNFVTSRPDLDNIEKFVFDTLNAVAYLDDSQIVSIKSQKTYSENPGVEVTLSRLEDTMVNEHAITYREKLSLDDLDYIVKKANRLGLVNRNLVRVFQEEDVEGTHVYFEVDGLKEKDE